MAGIDNSRSSSGPAGRRRAATGRLRPPAELDDATVDVRWIRTARSSDARRISNRRQWGLDRTVGREADPTGARRRCGTVSRWRPRGRGERRIAGALRDIGSLR